MRTSGAGDDALMTMTILGIALGASIVLFGGPGELAAAVNDFVRNGVEMAVAAIRPR